MPLVHKILTPTDFSDGAARALDYACAIAHAFGAPLVLLHVYTAPTVMVPEGYTPLPVDEVVLRDSLSRGLDDLAARARAHGVRDVECAIAVGTAWVEIVRAARDQGCDLIVIGTHGRGAVAHMLLGSVAERVVRKAACPVLTVGPKAQVPEPE